ncbi:MAG: endonuclease IV [Candidatus Thermoplasmatota archaeon]|nr:endonuclease IV [Candidatus Thermoplasmatota archaeon]
MIRFGIAGIPLTSKGRTFVDSVEDSHNLGLTALEVQLLRVNVEDRQALDYAGRTPREIDESIVVNVMRMDENGNYLSVGIDTVIEEDDIVQELFWNMARNYDEIAEGGELAKELDVQLSLHAPYYMDLLDDGEMGEKSFNHLKWSLIIGKGMGARRVVTHTGFYKGTKKDSLNSAIKIYSRITGELSPSAGYPFISVESSGKAEIFGTAADLASLAKKVKDVEPVINFPHLHSVTGGSLREGKDFDAILSEFKKYSKGDLYGEFSGVEYEEGNEVKLTAIKHGDLKFETLAEYLVDYQDDMTLISMSPLLEHDAQYMEVMYLRAFSRKLQKRQAARKQVA